METHWEWTELLRAYRTSEGLNQQTAAAQFGVQQSTWSRWERGTVAPSAAMKNKLLQTLRRQPRSKSVWPHQIPVDKWLYPGAVITKDGHIKTASAPLAHILDVPHELLTEAPLEEIVRGEALEIRDLNAPSGMFEGKMALVEICYFLEFAERFSNANPKYIHAIGWPLHNPDNTIDVAYQIKVIPHRDAREVQERLGGIVQHTPLL